MQKLAILLTVWLGSGLTAGQAQSSCGAIADQLIHTYETHHYTDRDSTFKLADTLMQLARECRSDSLQGYAYLYLAEAYYLESTIDSAVYYYQLADDYFHASKDTFGMMEVHFSLGNAYSEMGQIDLATSNYLQALPFFEHHQDTANIALTHYNISLLFFDQNNLTGAKRRLKVAQQLCEPNYRYETIYADVLQMLGHLYYLSGEYDSAKLFLSDALSYADSSLRVQYEAYTFANLALIFQEEDAIDSSLYYIEKAAAIARTCKDVFSLTSYLTIKADIQGRKGQYGAALRTLDTARQGAISLSSIVLHELVYEVQSDLFERQGDYKKAYLYLDSTYIMRDSIQQQNAEASILHYEREQRIERNRILEAENQLIARERTLKDQQLEERSILVFIIGLLMLLLLVAAVYLYQLSQKRKRLNDAKDTILSVISHDLRGPIVQMKSLSDLLSDPETEEASKLMILKNFNLAITNLQKSFENILFWSKSQMHGLHTDTQQIDLCDAIQEMMEFHQQSIQSKALQIEKKLQQGIKVLSDPNHLQIALRNILSNAIKFSNRGGHIYIHCYVKGQQGYIQIRDEGVGIGSEEMKQILNKQIRFSRIGTTNEKGTGLGVMLSKQFIQANKGEYNMESTVGKGTIVTLSLPLVQEAHEVHSISYF